MRKILTYHSSKFKEFNEIVHGVEHVNLICPVCGHVLLVVDNIENVEDVLLVKSIRRVRLNLSKKKISVFCNIHKGYVELPVLNYVLSEILEK